MNPRTIGLLGATLATLAWGGQFPVFSSVLHQLDPFWLAALRGTATSVVLVAILLAVEGPRALQLGERPWLLVGLGLIGFAVFAIFLMVGVGMSGAHHGALIVATTPLLATLIAWARSGQRPRALTLVFAALAFCGVALVVTKGNLASIAGEGSLFGDALILIGALSWAIYTLGTPTFKAWSPLRFSTLTVIFGTFGILIVTGIATALGVAHVPSQAALVQSAPGMAYLVLIGQALAILTWTVGVKNLGPSRAVLFMNGVPVVTFAISLALGERFAPVEYLGAAITVGALILNNVLVSAPKRTSEGVVRAVRPA